MEDRQFVVIGAGPAGLTAAYELCQFGYKPRVLERSSIVGGLSRTEQYKGFHFDMGGHRFFTKSKEVNDFWNRVMQDEFLQRPRLSRIYYQKRFFDYPLKASNALAGLGPVEAVRILLSYMRWSLLPQRPEKSFEDWVTNRFGKRLFEIFFRSYTEKVWGIPCSELRAEWAAQRIKNLSLRTAVLNMLFQRNGKVTSLIESFHYPRLGPGMLWKKVSDLIENKGSEVLLDQEVKEIRRDGNRITSIIVNDGITSEEIEGSDFISSMPVVDFIDRLQPQAPDEILKAAGSLKYRDFLTVCLIVNKPDLFPDNWVYIHEPDVQVGRIQNFKNWSPDMVPDPSQSSLGMEYFCNEGDDLWTRSDAELIEQAKKEIHILGLANANDVIDGCVFRMQKSYPVYDADYKEALDSIKAYIETFDNFQTIGRNGLHRYNNQDHSMLSAMLAVRNALSSERHDLWKVNAEQEYHEELQTQRA